MEITDGRVATIHYTLTDDGGHVIDKSAADAPLSYLHGAGNIVPGLEHALAGKQVGEKLEVDVPPEQGYGPYHDGLVQDVPHAAFPDIGAVKPGMQFEARTERGPMVVTVTQVGEETVTVDGNHPMAGKTLHFAVQVAGIREATEQESNQGHVAQAA
ncbi:peptidylprolyl isomerase [Luteimonas vadosa]|uniref:Peptidyl-prolyl cis-trans isomerase n=1 Tax=Luteimonas vadosa TaxID=1165507 RepID=A0ABP9E743_9GAMM